MEYALASVKPVDKDEARVVCCGAKAPGTLGLTCRWGNVEVPARAEAGGEVSCCVPDIERMDPDLEGSRGVPLRVMHQQEVLLEETVPLETVRLLRSRKGHSTRDDGFMVVPSSAAAAAAEPAAVTDPAASASQGWVDKDALTAPVQQNPLWEDSTAAGAAGTSGSASRDGTGGAGGAAAGPAPAATTAVVAAPESRKDAMARKFSALKPFVIISLAYLLFTTTDGAVRMIVLLHAYKSGFSAWQVAIMFSLYEAAGVFTNLAAGMMGARWGIKWTLLAGLTMQLAGVGTLYGWQDGWATPENRWKAILFVTCAQMLCGIAKDLTKLGGKTVTKLVTPDERQSSLFKLVSFMTGMKNSLKGIGYFIGSACVAFNYNFALAVLLALILAAIPWAALGLTSQLGRARKENLTLVQIFKQPYNINVLSVSRFFLFGSRDMWFEVPLPYFLRNTVYGLGWSRPLTGLFLAVWIIVYGQVQSWTPQLVLSPLKQMPANKYVAVLWNAVLVATPMFMGIMLQASDVFTTRNLPGMTGVMVGGLGAFCLVFAINSSIHSYLIVRYAHGDKVAMNVGFYYCANAMGRLTGTLVSGALYSYAGSSPVQGFAACFWASVTFALMSAVIEMFVEDNSGGLRCGPCLTCVRPPPSAVDAAARGATPEVQPE